MVKKTDPPVVVPGRREAVLRAALGCFSQHGLEATTIDMIRQASGASTGSLYHHFGGKEHIAIEVYLEGLRDFRRLQQDYIGRASSLEEGVRAIVYANVDWICSQPEWARYLFNHRGVLQVVQGKGLPGDALQKAEMAQSQRQFSEWFLAHMPPGQTLRWPLEAYLALVVGPVHDYARHWLAGQRTTDFQDLREFFAEAACRAVHFKAAALSPVAP
jgi:AcrR family transcriptional regulator